MLGAEGDVVSDSPKPGEEATVRDEQPEDEPQIHDEADEAEREAWEADPEIPRYATSTYGVDYPVEALVRRLTEDYSDDNFDIYIPPFQRGYVWTKPQADRFIESLLLGLPVPGVFLWKDPGSQRLAIIDGSQRLRTLKYFYEGRIGNQKFALGRYTHSNFTGKTYTDLDISDRRMLDDSIIHASVVRQEEPDEDHTSIFYIFQRINTGGSPAAPQEIRNAIYQGALNNMLERLNSNERWRSIYGRVSNRLKDQELILRFLALHRNSKYYKAPMKEFLNRFMAVNRGASESSVARFESEFSAAIEIIESAIGRDAFKYERQINAAVFDAVMVGVARRLTSGKITNHARLIAQYRELLGNEQFRESTMRATSNEQSVGKRLQIAIDAFASID